MKSEGKWTPGPWVAYQNPMRDDGWFVSTVAQKPTGSNRITEDGRVVPYMRPDAAITYFQINGAANAALISAAPDLYEALLPFKALARYFAAAKADIAASGHTVANYTPMVLRWREGDADVEAVITEEDLDRIAAALAKAEGNTGSPQAPSTENANG